MRCSASATSTPRIACGRWSSSAGSDTAGCRRSSARRRCRRIASFAPSASAAPRGAHGTVCRLDARRDVDAYVAGVNAFIADHHGRALPPEFTLLRFEPEPWTGADVLVWVKMMAWDLSANYSSELLQHDLLERVGPERTAQLLPPYPRRRPQYPERWRAASAGARARELRNRRADSPDRPRRHAPWTSAFADTLSGGPASVRDLLLGGARTEALGSNNWVVDGTLTASGKPLLANDPHLAHPHALALVSGASVGRRLRGDRRDAAGRARGRHRPQPVHRLGRDQRRRRRRRISIASGSNQAGDAAEFRGAHEPLRIIDEEIKVKGDDAGPLKVRLTRHGPLVSDAINANNAASTAAVKPPPLEPLAFRWTALDDDDRTLVAFLKLNEARNWTDFTAALRDFVVPSQNFVYADVDGHIGYYAPGRIPIRARGDGSMPADGWTGEMEWTGWIPFDELPHAFDPPEHFIVTANNRPMPADYPLPDRPRVSGAVPRAAHHRPVARSAAS